MSAMFVIAVAALTFWAVCWMFSPQDGLSEPPSDEVVGAMPDKSKQIPVMRRGETEQKQEEVTRSEDRASKKARRIFVQEEDAYTQEEQKLADNLQAASDDNDLGEIRKAVAKIVTQKNPELKQDAITKLGFFGRDALSDLMAFIKDSDDDVVSAATDAISRALEELDEDEKAFKAEFIATLLSVEGLCSKDAVEGLVGQLESLGSDDDMLAVQTILNLLSDTKVGDVVKTRLREAYGFITSEGYTTAEAAEEWLSQKAQEALQKETDEAGEDEGPDEIDEDGEIEDDAADVEDAETNP